MLLILGAVMPANAQVQYPGNLPLRQPRQTQQQVRQQVQQQMQQQVQQMQQVNASGTIEAVTSNGIHVVDDSGHSWQVHTSSSTKIHVTGPANTDVLRKDLGVEFQANLDAHGTSEDKVGDLRVVSLSHEKQQGVFLADNAGAKSKGIQPGMNRVVGRIMSYRSNHLIVRAGHFKVEVELVDDPKITVDVSDLSLAAPGDKATIVGTEPLSKTQIAQKMGLGQPAGQPQPTGQSRHVVQAQNVSVVLAPPSGDDKKKPTAKASPKKASKQSKTANDSAAERPGDK